MTTLRFKGSDTWPRSYRGRGLVFGQPGEEQSASTLVARALVADFPDAFEIVPAAELAPPPTPEPTRAETAPPPKPKTASKKKKAKKKSRRRRREE